MSISEDYRTSVISTGRGMQQDSIQTFICGCHDVMLQDMGTGAFPSGCASIATVFFSTTTVVPTREEEEIVQVLCSFGKSRPVRHREHLCYEMAAGSCLTKGLRHADFQSKGDGQTVVGLIGWWMAKAEHLQKYVRVWEQKEISTLCFCPEDPLFTFKACARKVVRNLKRHLVSADAKTTNVIFHVFSNNGCICLLEVLKQAEQEGVVTRAIKGIIMDSCPGYMSPFAGYGAIMAATKKSFWKQNIIRGFFFGVPLTLLFLLFSKSRRPYFHGTFFFAFAYIVNYWQNRRYRQKFHRTLSRLPNCAGELFLFSEVDELCTKDVIEGACLERKERRRGVSKLCFQRSPHVAHYLHYPQAYEAACWTFLGQILG